MLANNNEDKYLIFLAEKNIWTSVTTQGPSSLPRSLHTAVLIKNKVYSFGGWVPVVSEDGSIPDHETEWKCTNSLVCLNLGQSKSAL